MVTGALLGTWIIWWKWMLLYHGLSQPLDTEFGPFHTSSLSSFYWCIVPTGMKKNVDKNMAKATKNIVLKFPTKSFLTFSNKSILWSCKMKLYLFLLWNFELSLGLKCHRCPREGPYILREPYPACFINSSDTGYVQNCDPEFNLTKCSTEIIRKSSFISNFREFQAIIA